MLRKKMIEQNMRWVKIDKQAIVYLNHENVKN